MRRSAISPLAGPERFHLARAIASHSFIGEAFTIGTHRRGGWKRIVTVRATVHMQVWTHQPRHLATLRQILDTSVAAGCGEKAKLSFLACRIGRGRSVRPQ